MLNACKIWRTRWIEDAGVMDCITEELCADGETWARTPPPESSEIEFWRGPHDEAVALAKRFPKNGELRTGMPHVDTVRENLGGAPPTAGVSRRAPARIVAPHKPSADRSDALERHRKMMEAQHLD